MVRWFCLLAAIFSCAAAAQSVQNDHKDTISGKVVNAVTGDPVNRALVQFGITAVFTDANGRFELHNVNAALPNLFVRKPGYFSETDLRQSPQIMRAPVQSGPDAPPIVLKLTPEAIITGRVSGVSGTNDEPLENVGVRIFMMPVNNGRRRWQQVGFANTDEDGLYRLANLRPGSYMISVMMQPQRPQQNADNPAQGYPLAWFYPGAPDRASATAVEIGAGQIFRADLALRKQPVFRITGTVQRPPGVNAGGLQLAAPDGEFVGGPSLFFSDTGKFEFDQIPAGSYRVMAFGNDGEGHNFSASAPLNVSANVENVALAVGAPVIPIVVSNEFEGVPSPNPPLHVHLEGSDPPYASVWNLQEGTAENPDLVIRDARPGRYAAQFAAAPRYYVASATCGDTDLLRDPLTVPEGARMPPIHVTLRDDPGTLTVTLEGSPPAFATQLLILSDSAPTQQPIVTVVPGAMFAQRGYVFRGNAVSSEPGRQQMQLAPSDYTIFAFDRVDDLEYSNPEALRPYLSDAASVRVERGGKASVSVKIIKREE